jgi:hypothetical protein
VRLPEAATVRVIAYIGSFNTPGNARLISRRTILSSWILSRQQRYAFKLLFWTDCQILLEAQFLYGSQTAPPRGSLGCTPGVTRHPSGRGHPPPRFGPEIVLDQLYQQLNRLTDRTNLQVLCALNVSFCALRRPNHPSHTSTRPAIDNLSSLVIFQIDGWTTCILLWRWVSKAPHHQPSYSDPVRL